MNVHPIIKLAWIRAPQYCELKGEPMETVQERIKAGRWIAGKHYKRTGPRTLWIHWENVNEWLDQQPHTESSLAA
jgi:hypothetical protein